VRIAPFRRALAALLLLAATPASAASRVVVLIEGHNRVYLDGALLVNNGTGRVVMNQLAPGAHRVEVHSDKGAVLAEHTLQIPDGQEITVRIGLNGAAQSSAGTVRSAPPAGRPPLPPSAGPAAVGLQAPPEPQPDPQADAPPAAGASVAGDAAVASNANDAPPMASSFDMNEADGAGSSTRAPDPSDDWRRVSGTASQIAGSGVGSALVPGVGGVVGGAVGGYVAPRVASGAANVVRNAEAGGLKDYQKQQFKQGRPLPPKTPTGAVVFSSTEPMLVFLDGFLIGHTSPERPLSKTRLEVGRHALEFRDSSGVQVLHRGVVIVEKDQTLTLAYGPGEPPHALERSWNWSPR
jgi:hypothetical protein